MIKLVWWKTSNQNFLKLPLNKKKITHMWRRWSTPQNFLLTFIDELWKAWKIRVLKKKMKKKITGDIIILHMCTKNHNHMRYSPCDTEWGTFWPFFALYLPPPPQQQQQPRKPKFEEMKKVSGEVIILNLCNKKHNQIMYAYSDMDCNRHFFVILGFFFCSFTLLLTPEIKWKINWKKKWKTPGDISLWHMCTINQNHMMHGSKDKVFCYFAIFWPLTLLITQKNQNFEKIKKRLEIYHFTLVYQKSQSYDVWLMKH